MVFSLIGTVGVTMGKSYDTVVLVLGNEGLNLLVVWLKGVVGIVVGEMGLVISVACGSVVISGTTVECVFDGLEAVEEGK